MPLIKITYAEATPDVRERADELRSLFDSWFGSDYEHDHQQTLILHDATSGRVALVDPAVASGAEWDVIVGWGSDDDPWDGLGQEDATFTRETVYECLGTRRVAFSYDPPDVNDEREFDFWAPQGDICDNSCCSPK